MVSLISFSSWLPRYKDGTFIKLLMDGQAVVPDFASLHNFHAAREDSRTQESVFARACHLEDMFDFKNEDFNMSHSDSNLTSPIVKRALELASSCLSNAQLPNYLEESNLSIGVYVAAGEFGYLAQQKRAPRHFSEKTRHLIGDSYQTIAQRISYLLNLKGPSFFVSSACSSSLAAVQCAYDAIRSARCDAALVIGVQIDFSLGQDLPEPYSILSPEYSCLPLTEKAMGTYFSNGGVAVLLTSKKFAETHNLTAICTIIGVGSSNDGRSKSSYTAPSVAGQVRALTQAFSNARLVKAPSYVEMHGTATPIGDPIELEALSKSLENYPEATPTGVGSVKSNYGHLNAAAGLLGLLKVVATYVTGTVYPNATLGLQPSKALIAHKKRLRLLDSPEPLRDGSPTYGVTSLGIGGTNYHMLVQGRASKPSDRERFLSFF